MGALAFAYADTERYEKTREILKATSTWKGIDHGAIFARLILLSAAGRQQELQVTAAAAYSQYYSRPNAYWYRLENLHTPDRVAQKLGVNIMELSKTAPSNTDLLKNIAASFLPAPMSQEMLTTEGLRLCDAGHQLAMDGKLEKAYSMFSRGVPLLNAQNTSEQEAHYEYFRYFALMSYLELNDDHRRITQELFSLFHQTTDTTFAERVAKSCLLIPGSIDPVEVRNWLNTYEQEALNHPELVAWFRMVQGIAEYRCGHFAESLKLLESVQTAPIGFRTVDAVCHCFQAMALQQLGRDNNARRAYESATRILKSSEIPDINSEDLTHNWPDVLVCYIAKREAEVVLGLSNNELALSVPWNPKQARKPDSVLLRLRCLAKTCLRLKRDQNSPLESWSCRRGVAKRRKIAFDP